MFIRRAIVPFVALALVVVPACDESPTDPPGDGFDPEASYALLESDADVRLSAEAEAFAPGAEVTLTLENRSGEALGYNLCFHGLERFGDEGWSSAGDNLRICTAVLHVLESGVTATYPAILPASLGPGLYRFRTSVHLMERGEARDQVTEAFEVEG